MNRTGLFTLFTAIIRRDVMIAVRNRADAANSVIFYVIVFTLFPLAIGQDPTQLQPLAPGVIWIAALLATLLGLEGLFRSDFDDGSLEQLLLSTGPVPLLVLGKILAHWCVTGLPLILVTPLLAPMMQLSSLSTAVLLLTLLIGTPILSLVGSIGTALTVGTRRGGVLLTLIVLPLYIPVLVFGSTAVQNAGVGLPIAGQIYLLSAMAILALCLTPIAAAAAIKISLN
tara:strand:- start:316 stop:999 length:684 start_codon:yes stop_codon:yes gene_type:complete